MQPRSPFLLQTFLESKEYQREYLEKIFFLSSIDDESKQLIIEEIIHDALIYTDKYYVEYYCSGLSGYSANNIFHYTVERILRKYGFYQECAQYKLENQSQVEVKQLDETLTLNSPLHSEILSSIEKDQWSIPVMACAIEAKRNKKQMKGILINCFVIENNESKSREENDNFELLIKKIAELLKYKNTIHFQVAIKSGVHYTACDILIDKNLCKFLLIDSAGYYDALKMIGSVINKHLPDAIIYSYIPDVLYYEKNTGKMKERRIQFDKDNCAIFTLDHLFHLAKINSFDILEISEIKSSKTDPNYYRFNSKTCPEELAFLFRNTQSWEVLESYPTGLKERIINKKQQSLIDSAKAHSFFENSKLKTGSIQYKKQKIVMETKQYVLSTSKLLLDKVLKQCNGISFVNAPRYHTDRLIKIEPEESANVMLQYHIDELMVKLKNRINKGSQSILINELKVLTELRKNITADSKYVNIDKYLLNLSNDSLSYLKKSIGNYSNERENKLWEGVIFKHIEQSKLSLNEKRNLIKNLKIIFNFLYKVHHHDKNLFKKMMDNLLIINELAIVLEDFENHYHSIEKTQAYNIAGQLLLEKPTFINKMLLASWDGRIDDALDRLNISEVPIDKDTIELLFMLPKYCESIAKQMAFATHSTGENAHLYVKAIGLWVKDTMSTSWSSCLFSDFLYNDFCIVKYFSELKKEKMNKLNDSLFESPLENTSSVFKQKKAF